MEMLSMLRNIRRFSLLFLVLMFVFSGVLTACGAKSTAEDHNLATASLDDMPLVVKTAPVAVRQAYQFNVANPDVMTQLPCYCGCGAMGHTSNYSCYVSAVDADDKVKYDTHALGCSICVDITLDAMRLLQQDKTVSEIKAYVDQTYARYGLSNMP
jgi:hypothetical protein